MYYPNNRFVIRLLANNGMCNSRVGAGASDSINNSIDVYGAITNTVSGRNVHATKYGITFGISYGFQGFRPPTDAGRASAKNDEAFNPVCLCAVKEHRAKHDSSN